MYFGILIFYIFDLWGYGLDEVTSTLQLVEAATLEQVVRHPWHMADGVGWCSCYQSLVWLVQFQ